MQTKRSQTDSILTLVPTVHRAVNICGRHTSVGQAEHINACTCYGYKPCTCDDYEPCPNYNSAVNITSGETGIK